MRVGLLLQDPRAVSRVYSARALLRPENACLEIYPFASWDELELAAREDDFGIGLVQLRLPYVVLRDVGDGPGDLLCVMACAWTRCELMQHLRGSPKLGHLVGSDFLTVPLTAWPLVASIPEHARRHRLSVRTLYRRHRGLGIPAPDRLLRWGQLLLAAGLWHLGVRPLERVAILARRSGMTSLRKLCKDLTARDLDDFLEPESRASLWERLLQDLVAY